MTIRPGIGPVNGTSPDVDASSRLTAWRTLRPILLGRPLVALCALPTALLLRPDLLGRPVMFAGAALALVFAVSAAWALWARRSAAVAAQLAVQLGVDLLLVTALAARTGGQGSQFVLFYVLVVITGGLFRGLTGGLLAAAGAVTGFLWLPRLTAMLGVSLPNHVQPEVMVTFLASVGVLALTTSEAWLNNMSWPSSAKAMTAKRMTVASSGRREREISSHASAAAAAINAGDAHCGNPRSNWPALVAA